ncbi:hypothetical protein SPRG_12035 [Saprolegnia parasitica CBS 223.65]|uniref:Uncharacterized protein n=1 Tax=Saprolegnia parasitica (strain CBS 223.65) TaxID=695850 RepID=A0A067BUU5_SAPPC|nr:hypothetical protein SPRG_12035 [Saprolegnia parasitica CBS 223.65]KDO22048.1 hypothetical protein SPRG_12035 [Saprolegnia parasitica CBS 223.65]|eukprot:XP_012207193.1 hypothetical protein SPRG_12035 [Saprolegnia parasitica CBS 223.65]
MGSGPSSENQKAIVRYAKRDCSGSVDYTNVISTMSDGSVLSACTAGYYTGKITPPPSQYAPDTIYATISIPDMGSTEEVVDGLCVAVSPSADIYLKASCAAQDFAYYGDANCTDVLALDATAVSIICETPNPISWPATSTLIGQTYAHANCSGETLYAVNMGSGGIPYDVVLPHRASNGRCTDGLIYNTTVYLETFGINATYMTISRSYMTEVARDQTCVFTGDKYLQASCANATFAYYSDSACSDLVDVLEVGAVSTKCGIVFNNVTVLKTTSLVITSGGSGGAIALMLFCVLVGGLILGYLASHRDQIMAADPMKKQLKASKVSKSEEDSGAADDDV